MKKRNKKILITSITSLIAAGLVGASLFVAFRTKPILPLNTYLMHFNEEVDDPAIAASNKSKNAYIDGLIDKTRKILDGYQSYYEKNHSDSFPGLNFRFTNLNSAPTEGEKNYFAVLDRTFKAIDPRISFTNIPRTPTSVLEGYYNKNTDMINMYWSPDFDSIATWFTYVFSEDFAFPNQWPMVYEKLVNVEPDDMPWEASLKSELESKNMFKSPMEVQNNAIHPITSGSDIKATSVSEFYTELANVIGTWTENNSKELTLNKVGADGPEEVTASGLGIQFVQWLTSFINNLPFVDNGPDTNVPFLIRNGYYNMQNPITDTSFRDWFYNASVVSGPSKFRWWIKPNPFEVNKTPFNPAFSHSSSSMFFNACWTGLSSWTTTSDFVDLRNPEIPLKPANEYLVASGAMDLPKGFDAARTPQITFNIRPIPWVDKNGNQLKDEAGNPAYLSPADYRAAIIGFVRSIQIKINSNAYFFDLISIDVDATINDPKNIERNTSPDEHKPFVIHLKKIPDISFHSVIDILQKQYFNAIPAFKQSVKNITDYDTFKKLVDGVEGDRPNPYIPSEKSFKSFSKDINFNNFYGSGNPALTPSLLNDYAFTGPYRIDFIDSQKINFVLNEKYFECFKDEIADTTVDAEYDVPVKDLYQSFNLSQEIPATDENHNKETNIIKKIGEVEMKYAGSYSESLTYEQFKANQLDLSEINSAKLIEAKDSFPSEFRSQGTVRSNKSNLVTFNMQVYAKDDDNVILDSNENPIYKTDASGSVDLSTGRPQIGYSVDKYGNFVFPEGVTPKVKSRVSPGYYDLIIRDFYTPIDQGGVSATIRETLINAINWESLKTLVFPGITKSVQYSFLPYGVFPIGENEDQRTFFWYASDKPYMLSDLNKEITPDIIRKRRCGLILWTYDEMLDNSINKDQGGKH